LRGGFIISNSTPSMRKRTFRRSAQWKVDGRIHMSGDRLDDGFRIDGVLFEMMNPPARCMRPHQPASSYVEPGHRGAPTAAGRRTARRCGTQLDLRVSDGPTAKGEKTVMRYLDNRLPSMSRLMHWVSPEETLMIWKNQIAHPHGSVLGHRAKPARARRRRFTPPQQMTFAIEHFDRRRPGGIQPREHHPDPDARKIGMTFAAAFARYAPGSRRVDGRRIATWDRDHRHPGAMTPPGQSTLHTNDAPGRSRD